MLIKIGTLLICVIIATTATPIGGDGEAEELIAIADEGSATNNGEAHYVGVQLRPNPHKRSDYRVLESAGLRSHFKSRIEDAPFYLNDNSAIDGADGSQEEVDDFTIFNSFARSKREAEKKEELNVADAKNEPLPSAEAQTMEAGYYRRARSRLSDDSMAQASGGVDVGLRRVPRVNFVTQPRSLPIDEPEHRDLKASNANIDPMYRRPHDSYMPPQYNRDMGRGRFFDNNYGGYPMYDRYDPMGRDYVNQQRYDPYYPRYNQNQMFGNGYYPDRRYDYPETRNPYQGAYMNDVNYMGYPMSPNRRVIYYAHLPEIVRNNPYGESRGGYYPNRGGGGYDRGDGYDDPYYNNNRPSYMDDYNYRYYRDMNQYGLPPAPQPPPSVIYANRDNINRQPERDSNKDSKNKDTDSKTQTVSSNIRIQDSSNKGYRNYDSTNNHQAPPSSSSSDFTQPHYRME